jgi:CBS domain-containing protein
MTDTIRDVMTPMPCTIPAGVSVVYAARAMRENDIGDVIVVDDERLFGILTDRHIIVRVLAEERDPVTTAVGEILQPRSHDTPAYGQRGFGGETDA